MSILRGLRVIEISANGSASMATKHLADWGATVTILEPPGGTPLRNEPPYYDLDGERRSATWAWLSRGKTSARVASDDAVALCERADVVVAESELTSAVLGIEPSDLRKRFDSKTTFVLVSPFASDGPYESYSATDLGVNAMGGWMSMLGDPNREPLSAGRGILWRITGVFAFVSTLVALRHLRRGGAPQFVEVSAQAVAASAIPAPWLVSSMLGVKYGRTGSIWPLAVMECADGYIGIPPLTATHWEQLCYLMGIGDVLDHPRGRDPIWRAQHSVELCERVTPWLRARTRQQIFEEAQAWRLPGAPVQTIADRLACPQLESRRFWRTTEIDGKRVKTPRVAYSIEGVEPVERGPLREATNVELPPKRATASNRQNPSLPFEGIRVLDLTAFWSGPYATMLLGTLGADVLKIESVQHPDPYRFTLASPTRERWYEWGPLWCDSNCDKRSVTLDLASPAGKELFERLVAQADVVVSNFSNRVMPNLGLDNKRLLEINPRLIVVTMPGYGTGGPWETYVGYAIAFEQLICGAMTGYEGGVPQYAGGFCDPTVGMHTVAAIELALRHREETGLGTEVEVPQCEILDSLFAPEQIAVQFGAASPSRRGNKHDWMAPHDAYRCAGDDEWTTIAVGSNEEFAALASALGLANDARFAGVAGRKEHEAALDEAIADAVKERDANELERTLQAAGVKACRLVKGYLLPEEPGMQRMGFFQPITREVTGTHPYKTWPFRFSGIDTSHKRVPPLLGEHNGEVLEELGISQEERERLAKEGVIGAAPVALGQTIVSARPRPPRSGQMP